MQILNIWKSGIPAMCLAVSLLMMPGAANAAGCYPKLTQAEKRWDRMRAATILSKESEEEVRLLLTQAAELRHQAEIERCLRKVQKASELMDRRESRRRSGATKTN